MQLKLENYIVKLVLNLIYLHHKLLIFQVQKV